MTFSESIKPKTKTTMPMNIKEYLKVYDVFEKDFCRQVVEKIDATHWESHSYYSHQSSEYIKTEKELSISYNSDMPETKQISDRLWFVLQKYIMEDMAFCSPWFNGWAGYSQVRYNRYDVNTNMKIHCDHIQSMFDGNRKGIPTLTMLGGLNNDYEGGELIFWETEKIELKEGQVMVFPSNFLYPHKVEDVTKGIRYSFVSWAW